MGSRLILAMTIVSQVLPAGAQSKNGTTIPLTRFVIDENRAYVYLSFDRIGTGAKLSEEEPEKRIWFHFVNNCTVGIVLQTFGMPEGSMKNEVGLVHDVVRDTPQFRVVGIESDNEPPTLNAHTADSPQELKTPMGY